MGKERLSEEPPIPSGMGPEIIVAALRGIHYTRLMQVQEMQRLVGDFVSVAASPSPLKDAEATSRFREGAQLAFNKICAVKANFDEEVGPGSRRGALLHELRTRYVDHLDYQSAVGHMDTGDGGVSYMFLQLWNQAQSAAESLSLTEPARESVHGTRVPRRVH
jgi:hypothetical protein